MSVDWFTVASQIINFFILVWLLKKFLYRPILTAMENRQQKVKSELEQAANLTKSAEEEKKQYLALQVEAKGLVERQLSQAHQDAEQLRKNLFQTTKAEVEAAHVRWQNELEREKELFGKQASAQVSVQFQCLAKRAFRDLADENLEAHIVGRFCALISSGTTETDFLRHLQNNDELQVFTAFPLSKDSKEEIKQVLRERLGGQPLFQFREEPTLIAGILLLSKDHKLEWNIRQYLDDFQAEMEKTLCWRG